MTKIAVIGDIHLTYLKESVQYEALEFALESIKKSQADIVVCLGDATADGDINAAKYFLERMSEINLPKLFVLGNSDLRTEATKNDVRILETEKELVADGVRCIGINTSAGHISSADAELLNSSDNETLVFMHHPYWDGMTQGAAAIIKNFQENGNYKALVHGHMHCFRKDNKVFSLQALDPDKAIGEPPCVTYLVIEDNTVNVEFDYFPVSMPENIDEFLGLSCFNPAIDIPYAAKNNIKNIELRPGAVYGDMAVLEQCIDEWRKSGGRYLSLHMPDFGYACGKMIGEKEWEDAVACAMRLGVDGITVHVPKVSVADMQCGAEELLLNFLVSQFSKLPANSCIGIENMHMTASEKDDENRRFGYVPHECIGFMNKINTIYGYERVGLLLDVGHARNNAPYSERYPIGAWYVEVGKYVVAYHIHQVTKGDLGMENHMPIKSLYGPLISYCGFAHNWNSDKINQKPMFLEIRGGMEQYKKSVEFFKDKTNDR